MMVPAFASWCHPFFEGYSGNIFPYADYPQGLNWYFFSLVVKVKIATITGLLWWLSRKWSKTIRLILLVCFIMELKEVPEYILFANQISADYDIMVATFLILMVVLIQHLKEKRIIN